MQKLADGVVDSATPRKRLDDGRKVVIEQNNRGCLLGDLGSLDPHGKTDVGSLERQGVVGTVSRDRHRLHHPLEVRHEEQLIFGARAGEDLQTWDDQVQLSLAELAKGGPVHGDASRRVDSALGGDGLGREEVVTRDHAHKHTSLLTLSHGVVDLGSKRVLDGKEG